MGGGGGSSGRYYLSGVGPYIFTTTNTSGYWTSLPVASAMNAFSPQLVLVIAGNHQQYLEYLGDKYTSSTITSNIMRTIRPIMKEADLLGIQIHEIEDVVLHGTYWENPVWGSERYITLLRHGSDLRLPWARVWEEEYSFYANPDFLKKQTAQIIENLLEIERKYGDSS